MLEPQYRPFSLADAMILIAATTPGLILLRIAVAFGLFTDSPTKKGPPGRFFVEYLSVAGGCVLFTLSLAMLVLTARQPRSARRELVEGPGFVACLAVMVATVLPLAYFAVAVATSHGFVENITAPYNNMFGRLVSSAGPMIVGAWLALALVGRWRVKPIWTDRLGCVIGICWLLLDGYVQLYFIGALPLLRLFAN